MGRFREQFRLIVVGGLAAIVFGKLFQNDPGFVSRTRSCYFVVFNLFESGEE